MRNISKSLNPTNIDKSVSDIRIRIRFAFESSFWISVSGCKLTILPDIQPANRIVIISERHINKMVLWPGCEGRPEFSLHTKNVRSVRFVVKRRGCCCNLSGGVALIVWFTTNGMCVKNNTIMYVARTSNNRVISSGDLYCCLLPQCEALRTCRSRFPIATRPITAC